MAPPAHVLMIASGLKAQGGGAPVSEGGLAKALSARVVVTVLCAKSRVDRPFLDRFGIGSWTHTYRPIDVLMLLLARGHLWEIFQRADVVHINGHWRWENPVFGWAAARLRRPYFLHPRGMMAITHRSRIKKRVFNWLLGNRLMSRAAGVIALSRFETRDFLGKPISPSLISIIPNGIDWLESVGVENKRGYFLYFGRIESRKNLIFLVEAFARYRLLGGKHELTLMGPVERSYDLEIGAAISRFNLNNKVQIVPPDYGTGRDRLVAGSTAVIYPAVDEAFGRVPFEALALGVPTLIPERSGAKEYLAPHLSNILYPTGDLDGLARLMKKQEDSPNSLEEIQLARKWLKTELNWEVIASRIEDLYNRALHGKEKTKGSDPAMSELRRTGNLVI
ncbi:MAG: glycosyltransferase [Deltaproteobacteria bacterium]|nr:glycosyltransferase [Deltaproteobacteria bacterium]